MQGIKNDKISRIKRTHTLPHVTLTPQISLKIVSLPSFLPSPLTHRWCTGTAASSHTSLTTDWRFREEHCWQQQRVPFVWIFDRDYCWFCLICLHFFVFSHSSLFFSPPLSFYLSHHSYPALHRFLPSPLSLSSSSSLFHFITLSPSLSLTLSFYPSLFNSWLPWRQTIVRGRCCCCRGRRQRQHISFSEVLPSFKL